MREGRFLTARELGELAGVSMSSVYHAEHRGQSSPRTARALASALGVPVEALAPKGGSPSGEVDPRTGVEFPIINSTALAEAERYIDLVAAGEITPTAAKKELRRALFLAGDKE